MCQLWYPIMCESVLRILRIYEENCRVNTRDGGVGLERRGEKFFPCIVEWGEKKVRDGARLLARKEREHYPELRKNENNFSHSRKAFFFFSSLARSLPAFLSIFLSSTADYASSFRATVEKASGRRKFYLKISQKTHRKVGESFDRTRARHVELKLMVELSTNDCIIWAETLHFSPLLPSPSNSRFIWCLFRRRRSETGKGGKMVWHLADVNELGRRSKKKMLKLFHWKVAATGWVVDDAGADNASSIIKKEQKRRAQKNWKQFFNLEMRTNGIELCVAAKKFPEKKNLQLQQIEKN